MTETQNQSKKLRAPKQGLMQDLLTSRRAGWLISPDKSISRRAESGIFTEI